MSHAATPLFLTDCAPWPLSMRIALATPLRWRLRLAVMAGDMSSGLKFVRFSRQASGMVATGEVLGPNAGAWEV
jgi:hypothetical protein